MRKLVKCKFVDKCVCHSKGLPFDDEDDDDDDDDSDDGPTLACLLQDVLEQDQKEGIQNRAKVFYKKVALNGKALFGN